MVNRKTRKIKGIHRVSDSAMECAERRCHGTDLEGVSDRLLSSDYSIAVFEEITRSKRPYHVAFPQPPRGGGPAAQQQNVCRDFVNGRCNRNNCRFSHQVLFQQQEDSRADESDRQGTLDQRLFRIRLVKARYPE